MLTYSKHNLTLELYTISPTVETNKANETTNYGAFKARAGAYAQTVYNELKLLIAPFNSAGRDLKRNTSGDSGSMGPPKQTTLMAQRTSAVSETKTNN